MTLFHRLTVFAPFPKDAVILSILYIHRITVMARSAYLDLAPDVLLPEAARALEASSSSASTRRSLPILSSFSLHRLLLGVLLVSCKYISDGFIPQVRSAKVGGVALAELVQLEVDTLATLKWDLSFTLEQLEEVAGIGLKVGEASGKIDKVSSEALDAQPPFAEEARISISACEEASAPSTASATLVLSSRSQLVAPPLQPRPSETSISGSSDASAVSSVASSTSTSPSLFERTSRSPAPPSPLSSAGYSDDGPEKCAQKLLGNKASSETVRKLGRMSLNG